MKIELFLNNLKQKNFSTNTLKTYKTVLSSILNINENSHKQIKKIIINNKYTAKTQNLLKNTYMSYLKYWKNLKLVEEIRDIKIKKEGIIYRHVIDKEELYKKTKCYSKDSFYVKKYKFIIRFLFETGIRACELKEMVLENNKLFVNGKGNKKRQIFYKEKTLKELLQFMPDLKFGKHMKTLRIRVKEIIGSEYSLHSLRRSFATHMLMQGANPKMVMQQMGHSKIETTFSYLHLSEKKNQDIYHKFM